MSVCAPAYWETASNIDKEEQSKRTWERLLDGKNSVTNYNSTRLARFRNQNDPLPHRQLVDQGFDQWQLGGTEVLNDTPPPATGNVCLGVWTQLSPHVFKLKHPSWTFDNSGNLTGSAIISEQVTIDALGNNYQGPYSYDIYDLNGNRLQHFTGTIAAKRITVD